MKRIVLFLIVCVFPIAAMDSSSANISLLKSIDAGNLPGVQTALANGADVNFVAENGMTPLAEAINWKNRRVVSLLIDKGADVNSKGRTNRTPLGRAARMGDILLVALLIDGGARLNDGDSEGNTPLMEAVDRGDDAMVKFFLDRDVNVDQKNRMGETARDFVRKNHEIEQLLDAAQKKRKRPADEQYDSSQQERAERERYEALRRDRERQAREQQQRDESRRRSSASHQKKRKRPAQQQQPEQPMGNEIPERWQIESAGEIFKKNRTRAQALRVLGLSANASDADIKKRWRALLLQYHPDKNPGQNTANVTAIINEVHDFLTK